MSTRKTRTDLESLSVGKAKLLLGERDKRGKAELYDSLRVADWLLKSDELLDEFDGKYDDAEKHLEERYFGLVVQVMPLSALLILFRRFPEDRWAEYGYDMRAMYAEAQDEDAQDGPPRQPPKRYKDLYQEATARADEAESRVRKAHVEISQLERRSHELEIERDDLVERVKQLERDNAYLRGRLEEIDNRAKVGV